MASGGLSAVLEALAVVAGLDDVTGVLPVPGKRTVPAGNSRAGSPAWDTLTVSNGATPPTGHLDGDVGLEARSRRAAVKKLSFKAKMHISSQLAASPAERNMQSQALEGWYAENSAPHLFRGAELDSAFRSSRK